MKDQVAALPYADLLLRKEEIQERLQEITIEPIKAKKPSSAASSNSNNKNRAASSSSPIHDPNQVPLLDKATDVHWDFVMKEMMWLATDFQAERKRQMTMAKKIAGGVKQYHKTRESRRLRELAEAELKRRRLGARIGREVRGWWTKIERVIAYKQKLSADEERRKAMNRQLVTLVKQTERYTESLVKLPDEEIEGEEYSSSSSGSEDISDGHTSEDSSRRRHNKKTRRRKRKRSGITIEEALALGERTSMRRSKAKVIDYNRLRLDKNDDKFYGESTASDSGSDATYSPDENDRWTDDETTLVEAEALETRERMMEMKRERQRMGLSSDDVEEDTMSVASFQADPREIQILKEELVMPIEAVMDRYRQEMESTTLAELAGAADHNDAMQSASNNEEENYNQTEEAAQEDVDEHEHMDDSPRGRRHSARTGRKKVTFAPSPKKNGKSESQTKAAPRAAAADTSTKYDADDDADASDVEDFVDKMDKSGNDDDDGSDEFDAPDQEEVDDETTMEQEERMPQELSAKEEIDLLKAENEMPVEELRERYAKALQGFEGEQGDSDSNEEEKKREASSPHGKKIPQTNGKSLPQTSGVQTAKNITSGQNGTSSESMELVREPKDNEGGEEGEEEYVPDAGGDIDDETTIEAEERLGREMSPEEEVKMLQSENEIPVEQLRAMYASALIGNDDDDEEEGAPTSESDDDTRESPGESTPQSINAAFLEGGGDDEDETGAEEFVPEGGDDIDDETTMEAEEMLGRDMSYEDEIALLSKENEMSVEQLRAKYAAAFQKDDPEHDTDENNEDDEPKRSLAKLASSSLVDDNSDAGDDGEFVVGADEGDDETTMEAEERLGREMSYEDEIAMLQKESETPIEDLYEMYKKMEEPHNDGSEVEPMDEEEGDDVPSSGTKRKRAPSDSEGDSKDGKRCKNDDDTDEGLAALQSLEESAERARRTLASRPFLLAPWVKLREYQQIGLNWLVSLQTRRLNGILADGEFDMYGRCDAAM